MASTERAIADCTLCVQSARKVCSWNEGFSRRVLGDGAGVTAASLGGRNKRGKTRASGPAASESRSSLRGGRSGVCAPVHGQSIRHAICDKLVLVECKRGHSKCYTFKTLLGNAERASLLAADLVIVNCISMEVKLGVVLHRRSLASLANFSGPMGHMVGQASPLCTGGIRCPKLPLDISFGHFVKRFRSNRWTPFVMRVHARSFTVLLL